MIAATSHPYYLSNSNDYGIKDNYNYDPCNCHNGVNDDNCVNTTAACSSIMGLEAAFWTSNFDASNLENSLWPRALAMAERAWSNQKLRFYTNSTKHEPTSTSDRLGSFRCHLMHRGGAVLPLFSPWDHYYGSNRAGGIGSCMNQ